MVSSAFISAQFEKMFWVAIFTTIVVGRQIAMHEREVAVEATAPAPDLTLAPVTPR
jgi:hypothetical protein